MGADDLAGIRVRREEALSQDEILHYSRQLILPELGMAGQRVLKGARVLVVGAGGLGSPVLMYLAAAGVGTLGIVEFDTVDASNLHRQILFGVADIGRSKLEASAARLRGLNPHVAVVPHGVRLSTDNVLELVSQYDLVVDATDNFPTRYLINDACVLLGKPNVSASIFRFEGQVSVFWPGRGPCYRCLYPEPPPADLVPSCAEGGVLGVLPGIIGGLQANEALKVLLGRGTPLAGRLIAFDAMAMRFDSLEFSQEPDCPICSPAARGKGLVAYDELCSSRACAAEPETGPEVPTVTAQDLLALLEQDAAVTLLDVRNPPEFEISRIPGAVLIPLHQLQERVGEIPRTGQVVCYCHTGKRSRDGARLLLDAGFEQVASLAGGIDSWSSQVDRAVARY